MDEHRNDRRNKVLNEVLNLLHEYSAKEQATVLMFALMVVCKERGIPFNLVLEKLKENFPRMVFHEDGFVSLDKQ